jgi:exopolysaccharide biosynthesis predicted pyruvyltransferase EpsI
MNAATINFSTHPRPGEDIPTAGLRAPEELRRPFDELAEALLQAADGRKVIFLQNYGNYGDSLIRYGTIRFFEDIGLRYREYDMMKRKDRYMALAEGVFDRLMHRYLFVYSGSGAWADACIAGHKNVHRQFAANRNVFILPTTFQHYGLPSDVPVFVRDQFESWKVVPHAKFCHDMAFYLALVAPERLLADRVTPSRGLGLLFRTDNEAREHGLATLDGNVDISASGTHNSDPRVLLRFIDAFTMIATDRLHVAIAATLLGKKVLLTEGNYFKIRAIFDSSIKGIFDNCELVKESEMYVLVDSFGPEHRGLTEDIGG